MPPLDLSSDAAQMPELEVGPSAPGGGVAAVDQYAGPVNTHPSRSATVTFAQIFGGTQG